MKLKSTSVLYSEIFTLYRWYQIIMYFPAISCPQEFHCNHFQNYQYSIVRNFKDRSIQLIETERIEVLSVQTLQTRCVWLFSNTHCSLGHGMATFLALWSTFPISPSLITFWTWHQLINDHCKYIGYNTTGKICGEYTPFQCPFFNLKIVSFF
jgi:hypothetical protein